MTFKIGTYDHNTGEQVTREMTSEESASYEAELAQRLSEKTAKEAEKQAAKEALLANLGITEQQAIVLGLIQAPKVLRENGNE
jgi:hypothetical protein